MTLMAFSAGGVGGRRSPEHVGVGRNCSEPPNTPPAKKSYWLPRACFGIAPVRLLLDEDMKGSPTAGDFYHRRPTSIGVCEHEIASR